MFAYRDQWRSLRITLRRGTCLSCSSDPLSTARSGIRTHKVIAVVISTWQLLQIEYQVLHAETPSSGFCAVRFRLASPTLFHNVIPIDSGTDLARDGHLAELQVKAEDLTDFRKILAHKYMVSYCRNRSDAPLFLVCLRSLKLMTLQASCACLWRRGPRSTGLWPTSPQIVPSGWNNRYRSGSGAVPAYGSCRTSRDLAKGCSDIQCSRPLEPFRH